MHPCMMIPCTLNDNDQHGNRISDCICPSLAIGKDHSFSLPILPSIKLVCLLRESNYFSFDMIAHVENSHSNHSYIPSQLCCHPAVHIFASLHHLQQVPFLSHPLQEPATLNWVLSPLASYTIAFCHLYNVLHDSCSACRLSWGAGKMAAGLLKSGMIIKTWRERLTLRTKGLFSKHLTVAAWPLNLMCPP